MLEPGHEGDARLGLGFKVAAGLSGSGTEGGEAVLFTGHPGRRGIYRSRQIELQGPLNERAWLWHPQPALLPLGGVGPHHCTPRPEVSTAELKALALQEATFEPNV